MTKKIRISEAQYKQILKEGVALTIQGETDSTGKADTAKTAQVINNSGVDPKKTKVQFNGQEMSGGDSTTATVMEESRLITKKELQTNRLRYLKENSEVLSLNNFMKRLH